MLFPNQIFIQNLFLLVLLLALNKNVLYGSIFFKVLIQEMHSFSSNLYIKIFNLMINFNNYVFIERVVNPAWPLEDTKCVASECKQHLVLALSHSTTFSFVYSASDGRVGLQQLANSLPSGCHCSHWG
jgi:hypothetical protein